METKLCKHCQCELPLSDFYKQTGRKAFYICKSCHKKKYNANKTEYNRLRRERESSNEFKEKKSAQARKFREENPQKRMFFNVKNRAKRRGIEFTLTLEDIIIPKVCPILEIPIIFGTKGNYENTPSIDRIDNSRGYTKDNIMIISKKANSMKNSASLEELAIFIKNISRLIIK